VYDVSTLVCHSHSSPDWPMIMNHVWHSFSSQAFSFLIRWRRSYAVQYPLPPYYPRYIPSSQIGRNLTCHVNLYCFSSASTRYIMFRPVAVLHVVYSIACRLRPPLYMPGTLSNLLVWSGNFMYCNDCRRECSISLAIIDHVWSHALSAAMWNVTPCSVPLLLIESI
jgi:hypothetical protein